jgi:hypothetical protein
MPGAGQRSIGEILDKAAVRKGRHRDGEGARHFFQQLWWYDQVVFHASQAMCSDQPTVDGGE